jgi:hypothetical protein
MTPPETLAIPVGARLGQVEVEGRAVFARCIGFRPQHGRTVRGGDDQAVQVHGGVVGDEDPVRHAGVEADPGVRSRQDGRGWGQPGAVGLGRHRQGEGGDRGDESDDDFFMAGSFSG